jgi:transcriptional regulator with XRE-family HTH domain
MDSAGAASMVWTSKSGMAITMCGAGSPFNSPRGNRHRSAAAYTRRVATARTSPVGELLRHWRGVRHVSQLALAGEVATTQRHLSFIESGRSQPSRAMVLRLARVLDVPIRERNQLLLAAGYAPLYPEAGLAGEQATRVKAAVERMLEAHEPYPAVVMDRHWNVVAINAAAGAFFGWLLADREVEEPANVIRLIFDPGGLRPFIRNWHDIAEALVGRVHREAVGGFPDAETVALLEQALAYPSVPTEWRIPDFRTPPLPVVPVEWDKDGLALTYFSTVTTLGTPQDAMLQEIRIESFFPADERTATHAWT